MDGLSTRSFDELGHIGFVDNHRLGEQIGPGYNRLFRLLLDCNGLNRLNGLAAHLLEGDHNRSRQQTFRISNAAEGFGPAIDGDDWDLALFDTL